MTFPDDPQIQRKLIAILRVINERGGAVGARAISDRLMEQGYALGERGVRYHPPPPRPLLLPNRLPGTRTLPVAKHNTRTGWQSRVAGLVDSIRVKMLHLREQAIFITPSAG